MTPKEFVDKFDGELYLAHRDEAKKVRWGDFLPCLDCNDRIIGLINVLHGDWQPINLWRDSETGMPFLLMDEEEEEGGRPSW